MKIRIGIGYLPIRHNWKCLCTGLAVNNFHKLCRFSPRKPTTLIIGKIFFRRRSYWLQTKSYFNCLYSSNASRIKRVQVENVNETYAVFKRPQPCAILPYLYLLQFNYGVKYILQADILFTFFFSTFVNCE